LVNSITAAAALRVLPCLWRLSLLLLLLLLLPQTPLLASYISDGKPEKIKGLLNMMRW
jgi:hypothetical protein